VNILDELKQIISFVFKIKGKNTIQADDFINIVSYDLHWFSPIETGQLLNLCSELNLVSLEDKKITPTFDISKVVTAVDFKPDKRILTYKPKENVFMKIVDKISRDANINEGDLASEINKTKSEFPATNEVIALLVARKHNVKIDEFFDSVENEIKK
jgi:hypothetical protein